jgi:type III secretory pathway component EscS
MKKIIAVPILVATLVGIVSSLVAALFNAPEWCPFL